MTYFSCGKLGHIRRDYPNPKKEMRARNSVDKNLQGEFSLLVVLNPQSLMTLSKDKRNLILYYCQSV